MWDNAVSYVRQAGEKAAARSAHKEAVTCFEQALEALRHLPESRTTLEQAIDLRLDLRHSHFPLGEHGRIIDRLREAERLAERLDDPRRLGFVSTYTTSFFWMAGEPAHAVEWGQRALALAETCGDFALQVSTRFRLGEAYHLLGDYARAMEFLRSNVASLDSAELRRERFGDVALPSVLSRVYLVYCLAERGEFVEGIARAEEGLEIAAPVDHAFTLIIALNSMRSLRSYAEFAAWLAEAHRSAGRLDDALEVARRAFEFARERKARGQQAWALRVLGEIASHREPPEVEQAGDHYSQALAVATELGMRPLVAHCHLGLGPGGGGAGSAGMRGRDVPDFLLTAAPHVVTMTTMSSSGGPS